MRPTTPTTHRRRARLTAVLSVGIIAVLGAVWAAPRTSQAAAERLDAPQVRIRQLNVRGGLPVTSGRSLRSLAVPSKSRAVAVLQPVTLDAGMRFSMVGMVCDTPGISGGVVVRVRTSSDGLSWSRWYEAALEQSDQAGQAGESFTEPLWTGSARYVRVGARARTARAPVKLVNAYVVAIGSFEDADTAVAVLGAVRRTSEAAARMNLTASAAASPAAPTIVTRQAWGADESLRTLAPSYATVKMAFAHHTASGNDYTQADAPAIVRGIYAYHTQTLGWNDIGYNFLIDRFGTIYEGRYGGVSEGVVGAQVLGFNTGSTGVSVIGTFTSVAPSTAALTSLENLLAWKLSLGGLDPSGSAQMICGSTEKFKAGATVTLPVIAGHRDANYTECPGDALYTLLPTVRATVAQLINPTTWIVTLGLSAASTPTNSTVTYSGSVRTATGDAGPGTVTVQRRAASGGAWADWRTAPLSADGTYSVAVKMTNSNTWEFRTKMSGGAAILTGFSSSQGLTVKHTGLPKWRVTLGLSATSRPVGSPVRCSGTVKTASGNPVSGAVTIQRRRASGGSWRTWRSVTLDAHGGYAVTVRMTSRDSWQLRARMAGTAVSLVGYSAGRELTIF
jgi:hypothetical protein